ncbi:hypothetical protein [Azospirillum isscasi]|uniref:Secreted protein n=1 Tax=Azospirillum isscasi TaxID=3053926 RepID=A0ABU0WPA5_9PROT|nr:hypothetical protein [Azospirillum isscasi]MDQ2106070.1 hypothetical protein [Azospirillum isscasi]
MVILLRMRVLWKTATAVFPVAPLCRVSPPVCASFYRSFAVAKKISRLRNAGPGEDCPEFDSPSVEKCNHFRVARRAKPPQSNVMVAMTVRHATKPLAIGRGRRFWHEKSRFRA